MTNLSDLAIKWLYHNKLIEALIHTTVYELKKELENCESVLDLGCGPSSPLQFCTNIKHSVGVEVYKPYLLESKRKHLHDKYIDKRIEELEFEENSFDAVIMIEVLEHLPKEVGYDVLIKAEKWAKKKVILTTPNGYCGQETLDGNTLQNHLSGWTAHDLKLRSYKVRGLSGLKYLRKEVKHDSMSDSPTISIKWRPKTFWLLIVTLTQTICYYIPEIAFEIIAVKKKSKIIN